jgi:hypothetical protein
MTLQLDSASIRHRIAGTRPIRTRGRLGWVWLLATTSEANSGQSLVADRRSWFGAACYRLEAVVPAVDHSRYGPLAPLRRNP